MKVIPAPVGYAPDMPPETSPPEQWGYKQVAAFIDVKLETVRKYHTDGFMPPADGRLGQSPWWYAETIRAWHAARPGSPGSRRTREEVSA